MEFKEDKNNYYSKELNNLDRYLLRIIKRYFDLEEINNTASINAIITEAIARYKASIVYEQSLVAILNNKFGIVNININDLNGEKVFEKCTAFNKNFGNTKDTICIGNDNRLYDKRKPIKHHHKITDVTDLTKILDDIKKELSKYCYHLHTNMEILNKLKYTGTNTQIDLIKFESLGSIANMLLNTLEIKINQLIAIYDSNEPIVNDLLKQIYSFIQTLSDYAESSDNYIKDYLMNYVKEKENELDVIKENISITYPNKNNLNILANTINNTMLLIDSQDCTILDILSNYIQDLTQKIQDGTPIELSNNIKHKISINFTIPGDCVADSMEIESELVYNNTRIKLPYITDDFIISTGITSDSLYTIIQPLKQPTILLPELIYGSIVYNMYSKRSII